MRSRASQRSRRRSRIPAVVLVDGDATGACEGGPAGGGVRVLREEDEEGALRPASRDSSEAAVDEADDWPGSGATRSGPGPRPRRRNSRSSDRARAGWFTTSASPGLDTSMSRAATSSMGCHGGSLVRGRIRSSRTLQRESEEGDHNQAGDGWQEEGAGVAGQRDQRGGDLWP